VADGLPAQRGGFHMDGVAFSGAPIRLDFLDPAGGASGALFPTGRAKDVLPVAGVGDIDATLIDAGNPLVLLRAQDLGLTGIEMPNEFNSDVVILAKLEAIRAQAAVEMGLVTSPEIAMRERPSNPKIAWLAAPAPYMAADGSPVSVEQIDLLARIVSMGKLHHGFTGTGTIALAAAAAMPGTIAAEILDAPLAGMPLRFGHPSGVNDIEIVLKGERIAAARLIRHARVLMRGEVWV
jgi:2-methylaconitate cis-trans-isomerase PrpF